MHDYKVRPGYGSQEILIEFAPTSADREVFSQLLTVLRKIGVHVCEIQDLWMYDQTLLIPQSDFSAFTISIDIWELVFIQSPDNQQTIARIDEALSSSEQFRKL